ncbi:MAG: SRPBCC family protein [Proteiniphilum sp.]|jgi:carbon monoxide dehydrogenase subunit G
MTEFVSEVKTILYSDADVYSVLSDLRKLESVKDQIPENRLSNFSFDENRVSFRLDPIGEVTFLVEEREPNKMVKFKSEKLPFDVFLWIQLVAKAEKDTRLRLTVRADLNPFISGMAQKPMREMVDKISDVLTQLPYDRL